MKVDRCALRNLPVLKQAHIFPAALQQSEIQDHKDGLSILVLHAAAASYTIGMQQLQPSTGITRPSAQRISCGLEPPALQVALLFTCCKSEFIDLYTLMTYAAVDDMKHI